MLILVAVDVGHRLVDGVGTVAYTDTILEWLDCSYDGLTRCFDGELGGQSSQHCWHPQRTYRLICLEFCCHCRGQDGFQSLCRQMSVQDLCEHMCQCSHVLGVVSQTPPVFVLGSLWSSHFPRGQFVECAVYVWVKVVDGEI